MQDRIELAVVLLFLRYRNIHSIEYSFLLMMRWDLRVLNLNSAPLLRRCIFESDVPLNARDLSEASDEDLSILIPGSYLENWTCMMQSAQRKGRWCGWDKCTRRLRERRESSRDAYKLFSESCRPTLGSEWLDVFNKKITITSDQVSLSKMLSNDSLLSIGIEREKLQTISLEQFWRFAVHASTHTNIFCAPMNCTELLIYRTAPNM